MRMMRLPALLPAKVQLTTVLARHFVTLPIIDVGPLTNGTQHDEAAKQRVGQKLHKACRDVGFFYVSNHGMPEQLCSGVLQQARRWFSMPEHVKRQIAISPETHYRGYQRLGANVTRFKGGFQRDWHEAIDLYKEQHTETGQSVPPPPPPSALHGPNQWPTQLPEFDAALRAYLDAMTQLGSALLRGISLGLGLDENFFAAAGRAPREDAYWCARVIHYPPLEQGESAAAARGRPEGGPIAPEVAQAAAGAEVPREVQLSCGEHTDYGLLTLVNQEPHVTALQVKNAAGQWVNAVPVPGTFVCNIGDMFKVWTNGVYMPTTHRVINLHPTASRVSIAYFYEPTFAADVAPLPHLGKPQFQPVRYGSHLERKVFSNFEL